MATMMMQLFVIFAGVSQLHGSKVVHKHPAASNYTIAAADQSVVTTAVSSERHLAMMICGTNPRYVKQALRMVKSVVLSTTAKYSKASQAYHLWILMDAEAEASLKPTFEKLQLVASREANAKSQKLTFSYLSVATLDAKYGDTVNIFSRCCMVPIFMHELLPLQVKEIQQFGADQVIVDDLDGAWEAAKQNGWDGTKMFAPAEECVEPRGSCGWYNEYPTFGFGHNGLNAGSTLYSMENMRKYDYQNWALEAVKTHKIVLGDQDLLNIYAKEHPEHVSLQQCNVDLRTDSGCDVGVKPPIVLHGNRNVFENDAHWLLVAQRIDGLYNLLETKGQEHLPGKSIWDGIGADARNGLISTLKRPWGLTPRNTEDILKPLGPSTRLRLMLRKMFSFWRPPREHY